MTTTVPENSDTSPIFFKAGMFAPQNMKIGIATR